MATNGRAVSWGLIALLAALGVIMGAGEATAQLASALAEAPALPTAAEQWANSSPLTYDGMKGKGVVFWYFEETCPGCAKKWGGLKALADAYADKPVLFVAVNSGSDPRALNAYLAKHDIDWPVIADGDRSFEKASGVNEISLQNIHQVKILKSDGEFRNGQWNDLPATVEKALEGAVWKVKYEQLPAELHPAVRRMEYGDYRPAAGAINAGLSAKSPAVKKAAAQLKGLIEKKMTDAVAAAAAEQGSDAWGRFNSLALVADRFAPHKLPSDAAAELKKLERDPQVQQELKAEKAVVANAGMLASPEPRDRQRAVKVLTKVVENYPETRGAAKAKELLATAGAESDAG